MRDLLAPGGVLRAGINLSNFLLVSNRDAQGSPIGVSPDMAGAIANHLGVRLQLVPYESPGLLADAALRDEWDIGLIGAEPQRAEVISFTPSYVEIEATYLVPEGSSLHSTVDVDAPGLRIAVTGRTAYGSGSTATSSTPRWCAPPPWTRHGRILPSKGSTRSLGFDRG